MSGVFPGVPDFFFFCFISLYVAYIFASSQHFQRIVRERVKQARNSVTQNGSWSFPLSAGSLLDLGKVGDALQGVNDGAGDVPPRRSCIPRRRCIFWKLFSNTSYQCHLAVLSVWGCIDLTHIILDTPKVLALRSLNLLPDESKISYRHSQHSSCSHWSTLDIRYIEDIIRTDRWELTVNSLFKT